MKNLILIIILQTILFANPSKELLDYQDKYTLCNEKTKIDIAHCIINTTIDYNKIAADEYFKIDVDIEKLNSLGALRYIKEEAVPQTERYKNLENYLTKLYLNKDKYTEPKFKKYNKYGVSNNNIKKTKRILNILYGLNLKETPYFGKDLKKALKKYQTKHGFEVNGKLWKETRNELNKPFNKIVLRIKKNLEIERSLSRKKGTYVYINIPEFKMYYFVDNKEKISMNVVVGKKNHKTPIFLEDFKYIVLNPVWNVPDSIYYKEYSRYSDDQLYNKGFSFNEHGKLYQRSGKRNALGLVKFLFPNTYNVYMHDTSSKYLFKKRVRAYSHGCIRLSKPFKLLEVLGYKYSKKKENKWIRLPKTIPVHVEYHTAWIDSDGDIQFRNDIYGYEKKLF